VLSYVLVLSPNVPSSHAGSIEAGGEGRTMERGNATSMCLEVVAADERSCAQMLLVAWRRHGRYRIDGWAM